MLALKTYSHSVMSFRLLCRLWTSVWPLLQLFCLLSLNIDLFQGGSYKLKWRCHAFLACWLSLWAGLYLMCFIYFWLWIVQTRSRFVYIHHQGLLSHALSCLFTLCWRLSASLCPLCQVCRKTIFCSFGMFKFFLRSTLFCFSFEYCWLSYLGIYSACVNLRSVDLVNLSKSCQI